MSEKPAAAASWRSRMRARDPEEPHRAATPLELLFDLCFAVAVAQASTHFHHGIADGHWASSLAGFGLVFFAIWWAWMNFTWFASAYDTDDGPYRLNVLLQIAGVLGIAAGVDRAFEERDFLVITLGYATMRVGLVALWLRAAREDPEAGPTPRRYAIGLVACQVGWLALLLLPVERRLPWFLLMIPAEFLVPVVAERAGRTCWHARHIAERYGCFTLVVLAEAVLSSATGIQSRLAICSMTVASVAPIVGGLLVFFGLWWIYFDEPAHDLLVSSRAAFVWGYGHLPIFASVASVGAGLAVAADAASPHGRDLGWAVGAAVTAPVAVFLLAHWLIHVRPRGRGPFDAIATPTAAGVVLALTPWSQAVLGTGLVLVALITANSIARARGAEQAAA